MSGGMCSTESYVRCWPEASFTVIRTFVAGSGSDSAAQSAPGGLGTPDPG